MTTAQHLLDHAERLVDEEGFSALSVRRLADAVGMSRQVVYTHFDGMSGVLDALHRRGSEALFSAVRRARGRAGSTEHAVAVALAYCEAARAHPRLFELTFARPVPGYLPSERARRDAETGFGALVEVAAAWLERHRESATRAQAARLARVLWSTTHGHVVLEQAEFADPGETDELVTVGVRALLAGWPH